MALRMAPLLETCGLISVPRAWCPTVLGNDPMTEVAGSGRGNLDRYAYFSGNGVSS